MTFASIRDVILLLGGLVLLGYEVVIVPEPRPIIIAVAVAMLGLPASLIADRGFLQRGKKEPPKDPPKDTVP